MAHRDHAQHFCPLRRLSGGGRIPRLGCAGGCRVRIVPFPPERQFFSPSVRIQIWSVWQSLNFVLNGLVFVLIGLQLPAIRASIREYSLSNFDDGRLLSSARC